MLSDDSKREELEKHIINYALRKDPKHHEETALGVMGLFDKLIVSVNKLLAQKTMRDVIQALNIKHIETKKIILPPDEIEIQIGS